MPKPQLSKYTRSCRHQKKEIMSLEVTSEEEVVHMTTAAQRF